MVSPALQPFSFLDLPREIRNTIYRFVLSEGFGTVEVIYPQNPAYEWEDNICLCPIFDSAYQIRFHGRGTGVNKTVLNIFHTNQQIRKEASDIFYGNQKFVLKNQQAHAFRTMFVKTIGDINTSNIRFVSMNIPHCLKQHPNLYLRDFLHLFINQMPRLRTLLLSSDFPPCTSLYRIPQEYTTALYLAATVACRHPFLKCAAWLDSCPSRKNMTFKSQDPYPGRRNEIVRIKVKLTSGFTGEKQPQIQSQPALILDTRKICDAGMDAVRLDHRPENWALDIASATKPSQNTSELDDKFEGSDRKKNYPHPLDLPPGHAITTTMSNVNAANPQNHADQNHLVSTP